MLVERLQPELDPGCLPLFQVMFVLQNEPLGALTLPGLTLSNLELDGRGAKAVVDIAFAAAGRPKQTIGTALRQIDLMQG